VFDNRICHDFRLRKLGVIPQGSIFSNQITNLREVTLLKN